MLIADKTHMPSTKEPLIEVKNLTINFNGFTAVNDISFSVKGGEVLGLLGGNGAGKSTTLKVLGGILKPTSGELKMAGYNLRNVNDAQRIQSFTGYCPDVGGLISGLSPREHIKLLLTLHNRKDRYDEAIRLVEMFGLTNFIDTPSSGFSHGMSRRLSVLLATIASDKILILDEPFDGVDPLGVEAINEVVRQAKKAGLAVIVSTHLQSLLVNIADNVMIMKKSQIVAKEKSSKFHGKSGEKRYRHLLNKVK